jgi:hypothetical protein
VLLLAGRVCTCAPRKTAPRGRAPRGSREREESAGRHADVTGEGGGSQRKKASPHRGDEYRPRARARACVYDAMGSRKDKSKPIGSAFPSSLSPPSSAGVCLLWLFVDAVTSRSAGSFVFRLSDEDKRHLRNELLGCTAAAWGKEITGDA